MWAVGTPPSPRAPLTRVRSDETSVGALSFKKGHTDLASPDDSRFYSSLGDSRRISRQPGDSLTLKPKTRGESVLRVIEFCSWKESSG